MTDVDRSQRILTSGKTEAEQPDYREKEASGQQKAYVVLTPEERAKGYVRPIRRTYIHCGTDAEFYGDSHVLVKAGNSANGGKACGSRTTMGVALAETYARDPYFYAGTFCCSCGAHFDLDEFVWEGTRELVGS